MSIGHALSTTMVGAVNTPLGPLEPSGSWIVKEDNFFAYSRDGKNWGRVAVGGINNTPYRGDVQGIDYLFLGVNGAASSFKSANKGVPDWDEDSGADGIGLCQWPAFGAAGWVARTTTQLRTSGNGIAWTDNDASAPANWSSINSGPFRYSPTAGLYISCGSTFSIGFLDQYFTSSNRLAWTQRTFPVDWDGNGQTGFDWFVDNGSIAIMAMQSGLIYSSTDLINWTLRHTAGALIIGCEWNPILGAFYASVFDTNPDNLIRSTDGITWTSVAGNNLTTFLNTGQIAVDPVTGLMFVNTTSSSTAYQTSDSAVSVDGVTWSARWARSGNSMQHAPGKYGSVISDALTITPDPITISDAQGTPTTSFVRLIHRGDGTVDRQTAGGGIVEIGSWMGGLERLNPHGREVRLDQIGGSALNFGTSNLGVWESAGSQKLWGYTTTLGVLTGTFTYRVRDKITLVEDTNGGVLVTLSAEST